MSRKDSQFPWRVVALSVLLFGVLAAAGWFFFAPVGPNDTAGGSGTIAAPGDGAGAPANITPPQTATPPNDPQGDAAPVAAGALDPTTPEGRAALAVARAGAGTMQLQLFLIVPGLERLVPVSRTVAAATTLDAQVRRAVEELINWTGTQTTSPVAPEVQVRETWVSPGGIAYLDFDRSFFDFSGSGSLGELHTIYGIVATVTVSFPEIVAVQFLLEGEPMITLAGHIDLSRPLLPSGEWVLLEQGGAQIQQSDEPR